MLIVLPLTGWTLNSLYRGEVERGFDNRLEYVAASLIDSSIGDNAAAPHVPADFGDELYNLPLTGWYWQISPVGGATGTIYRSASLVGETLVFPTNVSFQPEGKPYRVAVAAGPDGRPIRMFAREITFGTGAAARRYTYIVTGRVSEIDDSVTSFRNRLAVALTVLGLGLVLATVFQVRFGLSPLRVIERELGRIRSGDASRLEGDFPAEVQPLQRELNALITSNEDIVERARTHVGNLAHALKTPLSVITNEATAEGGPFAAKVKEQAGIMRDQVQHHLDRARMVARVGTIASVTEMKPVADALARTLARIYGARGIAVSAACADGLKFRGERQDIEEILGNLLDNACKWAGSTVHLDIAFGAKAAAAHEPRRLVITVDDDGPGLSPAERKEAVRRGRRLDETKPGSGLGLSIVSDLVGLYGGTFELERSDHGGLRARLVLPAA
ncbi:MAG: HAMP domain-containing sensor histidine kinase [Hyphomicrobiaceae bacterium]